ncbi:ABC transporter ATP-binding protein [Megalodesulfovibrio gigas]|uniref:Putative oligopeptide/dipeptide ABC transporter ATP-binding protein n=1 Tax=Megalodesulfovibrio gigas (strain ATCC 19364 / DSM 1382 / NCIMB 9332 / VKM B-1759) TaxID=1121448 RepID=T2GDH5_MEGG1|nr:ABC transporter ATP-binding protein [Megalodesulfovibrio gigas]AGW14615.1 putative oligopeptide/dipeptide ABC transporter ATP-binding protein [Megalodesulfovibrio gigas DSM 1382 = ATCC 19364]
MPGPLLDIQDLRIGFLTGDVGSGAVVQAVQGVSLQVHAGETLALVGESGSGKTVTALSALRLLPPRETVYGGRILLDGTDVLNASPRTLRQLRGGAAGVIFQEPMTALNPLHTVEGQIGEVLALHKGLTNAAARRRVLELLELVGIDRPETRLKAYPHQLSGGQRQRVMIAMALAGEPKLLIADEPTTALDVTIQAQILELIADLQRRLGMAVLLITHDLGVVRSVAHRTAVMHLGELKEVQPTAALFAAPQHDYTKMLLAAEPAGAPAPVRPDAPVLLETQDLRVWFPVRRGVFRRTVGHVKAVDGISFAIREGESLGIVGESGSGKTTLGLAALRLERSEGGLRFAGQDLRTLQHRDAAAMRTLRQSMQIVFQDPFGSLSPRLTIQQIVDEGLVVQQVRDRAERERRVAEALTAVGLDPAIRERYPHEFSGGQRQRIAIARALVLRPRLVVLDEPTSSLDRSVQAQVVALLRDLQTRYGLAYCCISHDLKIVRALCHRILVMRQGVVVEEGDRDAIFNAPQHPYTQALLAAALR